MEGAASSLFRAMDGLGTDEDAIHAALRGRSPAEIAEIRRIYADHYPGRTLDADLSDELSGDELGAAQAALSGDPVVAAAATLQNAASGLGTDEAAIQRTLEGISDPTQRAAVAAEFERRTGQSLDAMLDDEMSGADLTISRHLADGNVAGARAARMDEAMNGGVLGLGIGTDEDAVYSAIESCRNPEERAQMLAQYRQQTGRDLQTDLDDEFSGSERDVATSLVAGDRAGAAAARMAVAADGMGTDEDAIFRQLEGRSFEERAAIVSAYNERYGAAAGGLNFQQMLDDEMGQMDSERARQLATNGRLDPAFAMRYAMDGFGTDEQMIRDTLQGRSADDIRQIRQQYADTYGGDLDDELAGENSGRDGFEISQLMLGEPRTPEEVLARANAAYDFERGSGAGVFGRGVTDLFSDSGEMLDEQHRRMQELSQRIQSGQPSPEDLERLQTIARYQGQDVQNYQAARDAITNSAAIGATAVVGTAATVLTGGAAGPAVAAAIGALAGGAAGMGVKYGMQGSSYSVEDAGVDAAMMVVSAASAGVLQGSTVTAGLRGVMGLAGNTTATLGQTVAMEAMRGGAMGLVNGVAAGALDERTWRGPGNGLENFLHTAGVSTLGGAASGAGSAGMGGLMGRAPDGMDPRQWGALTGGLGGVAGGVAQTAVDPAVWEGRWEDVASRFGQNAVVGAFQGAVMGASEAHRQMLREQSQIPQAPPRNIDDPALQLVDNAPPAVAQQAVDQNPDLAPAVATTHPDQAAQAAVNAMGDSVPDTVRAAVQDSPDLVRQAAAMPDAQGNPPRTMEEFIARVRELQAQGAFANSGFHGSSSEILPGLAQTDGALVSAQELANRGITQVSGEGDAFSGASGLKRDIFIGTGEAGLGTGLAYANASETLPQYNPSVLTSDQLAAQIAQLSEVTARYPEVAALAQQGGIMNPDGSPAGMLGQMGHQSPEQLANTLARLQQEAALRSQLAADNPNHPRVAGGPGHGDNFPVMFQFGMDGVNAVPVPRQGDALAGEATVRDQLSLRDRMERAFAPMANLPEAQAQLAASLGHDNFEMIPLEALQQGLQPGSQAARSQAATLQALQSNQARVNAIQQMYMTALMSGQPIDFNTLVQSIGPTLR